MIYLDTSAALKALIAENGSDRVRRVFADEVPRISSRLLAVELHAVVDRRGLPRAHVSALLDAVDLVALDDDVARRAIELRSGLRSLDALHLATAVKLSPELTGFLSFDEELRGAATRFGLPVM